MAKATQYETRDITCVYKQLDEVLDEYNKFGWIITNKQVVDKNGNPIPNGEKIDEDEAFYKLSFSRTVIKANLDDLNRLQLEYEQNPLYHESFGGKPVTGIVFLSIAFVVSLVFSYSFLNSGNNVWSLLFLFNAILIGGFISMIFIFRFIAIKKRNKEDITIQAKRDQIVNDAKTLL